MVKRSAFAISTTLKAFAARIVLVIQRVRQDDLAGYLQGQGGAEVLNLPARSGHHCGNLVLQGLGKRYARS